MSHKLGLHWLREHPDNNRDFSHIERMRYPSIKLFKNVWDNRDACAGILSVLPRDSYILARDHSLSEQKEDMWRDPDWAGANHADQWIEKVRSGQCYLPTDRTFFLGINEPDATHGDRGKIDRYTAVFLRRLQANGLRGGAFNFSTGHPRTVDGTPNTLADYTVFEQSHQAIVEGHHIGVLHIYGTGAVPCAPGHYDRLKACAWQDVQWVVGEFGVDEHVIGGGEHAGFHSYFNGRLNDYCGWLDSAIMGINDPRIHSYQVFTYDFSHPWDSFDVSVIGDALESYQWQHAIATTTTQLPVTTHLPTISTGQPAQTFYVNVRDGANLRAAPTLEAAKITAAAYGQSLTVVGSTANRDWLQVEWEAHRGWVYAALLSDTAPALVEEHRLEAKDKRETWGRSIAFVRRWEGGFANDPNDPGGPTNKGITIGTFTRWRTSQGQPQPTVEDLRNISDEETDRIYFEWYYLASGADKLPWPLALAVFNIAVNAGPERAKQFLFESGGDFLLFMAATMDWYTKISGWQHFGAAWTRRNADVLRTAASA